MKKRNGSLMKTMVERRTEKAYPLFIQSLRQAGQDSVANLLTDIGEETRILTHLQSELEHEIGAITDYIHHEEKRTGMAPAKGGGGGRRGGEEGGDSPEPHPPPPAPTSDREVWVGVQSSLKRAKGQFERCRAVIDKLHQDCEELAQANGDMVIQIRNCYSRVRRMLKPGRNGSQDSVPKSTHAMFQSLVEDVEKLMSRKSKAQKEENEGRTTAMRMLRHLRDWIQERSAILETLHATKGPSTPRVNRLPLLTPRLGTSGSNGGSRPKLTPPRPRHSSPRQPSPSTPSNSPEEGNEPWTYHGDEGQDESQGQSHNQGEGHELVQAEHVRHVEPHAISTVLEGLHLLEQQVRQYIHLEIQLTDRFRAEMRYRHLKKKSHGYTPEGLGEARKALTRLESSSRGTLNHTRGPGGGGDEGFYLSKLRASFDAMCEEYNACAVYMNRIAYSLVKVPDIDAFLTHTADDSQPRGKKNKKRDKERKNHLVQTVPLSKDKPTSVFSLFSRSKKDATPSSSSPNNSFSFHCKHGTGTSGRDSKLSQVPALPHQDQGGQDASLLSQLKLLVANYEMVKQKLNRVEDKYRREYDHKRRSFDAILRDKEDEVTSLIIKLKETEAEKEKFRSLYDKMKISHVKKR